MNMHPSDVIYALERAIANSQAAGEAQNVINDLRQMHDDVQRSVREGRNGGGLNFPNTATGD